MNESASSTARRWEKHRDRVVYTIAGVGFAVLGLVWKGSLSMILSPFWMLLVAWLAPTRIERWLGYRR